MLEQKEFFEKLAGNWRKFDSFSWSRAWNGDIENPDEWGIIYTKNRDSGLIELSNHDVIKKLFEQYIDNETVLEEYHNHWAVGYVKGFSIHVFINGAISLAALEWYDICSKLEDYPLLDEDDYSNKEYEAMIENLESQSYLSDVELPENWIETVLNYCEKNHPDMLENRDGQGAYIDCNQVFSELNWRE